jgi:predicted nuclease of predicted toxin-antitoxin system
VGATPGRSGVRLLIDEMWPATLAEQLRRRGHDVVAVSERADLAHRGDDVIFECAAREGRVLLTENVPDFVPLAVDVLSAGGTFPGLLLTSNAAWPRGNPRTLGRVVRALDALLAAHPSDTALQGRVEWLTEP